MPENKVRLNFVVDETADRLRQHREILDIDEYIRTGGPLSHEISSRGDLCWGVITYLRLRDSFDSASIELSSRLDGDAINFVHSPHLQRMGWNPGHFIVCIRADFPAQLQSNFHIVQNAEQAGRLARTIYLWPQPGLIPRQAASSKVSAFAYSGQAFNGNLAETIEEWKSIGRECGLDFINKTGEWHDLSQVDVLVGVRSFSTSTYPGKPPSKLLNAWRAGIPFIGGNDSAYSQVGTPGEDYLRATSRREVISHLQALKCDPDLYRRLVERGYAKSDQFSSETMVSQWTRLIEESLVPSWRTWMAEPLAARLKYASKFAAQRSWQVVKAVGKKLR